MADTTDNTPLAPAARAAFMTMLRQGDAEIERLKALLIKVIQRLAKHEPDALQLLDQIAPPELNDSLDEHQQPREAAG